MSVKNYNVRLKETIATMTKLLFYVLFDEQNGDDLKLLERTFLEIATKLSIANKESVCDTFKGKFPEIRKKLDLDAIAIEKHDPATQHALSVEKF